MNRADDLRGFTRKLFAVPDRIAVPTEPEVKRTGNHVAREGSNDFSLVVEADMAEFTRRLFRRAEIEEQLWSP